MKVAASVLVVAVVCAVVGGAAAQDPATGWMAYAQGKIPSTYTRVTKLEMSWKVLSDAQPSGAFYSPWFGMNTPDRLNLIQPVNPWFGSSWSAYTEYFQWSPEYNSNSNQFPVSTGDVLRGSCEYMADSDSYNLTQFDTTNGGSSSQIVKCQDGKKFTIPLVVFEKTWPCGDYPSDDKVTFFDISVECDGEDCTDKVEWSTNVKDPNCNMAAHIDSSTQISITWDTSAASRYDDIPRSVLSLLNTGKSGWSSRTN